MWRRERKANRATAAEARGSSGGACRGLGMRTISERADSSERATVDRRRRLFKILSQTVRRRLPSDTAHALDLLIQSLTVEQRTTLRSLSSVQQE
eukprot:5096712-Pleurochrysis_carterae.AAC.1